MLVAVVPAELVRVVAEVVLSAAVVVVEEAVEQQEPELRLEQAAEVEQLVQE